MILQSSILKTIAFFDLFDFPLTAEEVQRYLYGYGQPVHIKEIKGTLALMPSLESLKDYYFLKGRGELVRIREARQYRAQQYWDRVKFYGLHMRQIPFVRMIAVCNTLSYNNVTDESDIDLLVITEPGRLWTARLFLTLLLQFFGVRRHGNKIAERFCLSFFVTTQRLNFQPLLLAPEDPYLAYWLAFLAPIEGRETYDHLKKLNEVWLKADYGLIFPPEQGRHFYALEKSRLKRFQEWTLRGRLGDLFEKLIQYFWKKRTQKKAGLLDPATSGVRIENDFLKFHDHDRRREYYDAWIRKVTESPLPETQSNS
ncbi:hypothetical protein HZA43_05350 [Candidatus Peregrinibacteria bacterium]|nr:hypothetical protein [Candidatus Peregrinibacteria bacterium]